MRLRLPVFLAFAAISATALCQVYPPTQVVQGKTLTQWMNDYFVWLNTTKNPVPYQPVESMVFLPIPNGTIDVTIKQGTSYVLPLFGWVTERYRDGSEDPFMGQKFWRTIVNYPGQPDRPPLVTLNGKSILSNFWSYYFDGTYFPEPILYSPPHNYGGGVYATHAIGVEGIGFIGMPLPVGDHVLTLDEELSGWGVVFSNRWNIHVVP